VFITPKARAMQQETPPYVDFF